MENSGIYIRVGKENVLLEDLPIDEFEEFVGGLSDEGLKRALFVVCCALRNTRKNCNEVIQFLKTKPFGTTNVDVGKILQILEEDY